jgi:serine/threonine protein kinase
MSLLLVKHSRYVERRSISHPRLFSTEDIIQVQVRFNTYHLIPLNADSQIRIFGLCVDHWSTGVLIFEMLTGDTPFYEHGMDQMTLFRSIVKAKFTLPSNKSEEACSMITGFLNKHASQRLGSLAQGEDDILEHPWFQSKDPIDFDELRTKARTAPMLPQIKDPLDSSNFEDWSHLEDKTKMKYPKLSTEYQKFFDGF